MTGDFYRSIGYPNIDRANGGSLNGMVAGLNKIVELSGPSTKIVPGHGAVVDRTAVTAHRDILTGVRDKIAPMVKKGMTLEQVTAAKPTAATTRKCPASARPASASSVSCIGSRLRSKNWDGTLFLNTCEMIPVLF